MIYIKAIKCRPITIAFLSPNWFRWFNCEFDKFQSLNQFICVVYKFDISLPTVMKGTTWSAMELFSLLLSCGWINIFFFSRNFSTHTHVYKWLSFSEGFTFAVFCVVHNNVWLEDFIHRLYEIDEKTLWLNGKMYVRVRVSEYSVLRLAEFRFFFYILYSIWM